VADAPFSLSEVTIIGENRHGYTFAVGKLGEFMQDRWVGFAVGEADYGRRFLFVFPEIGEEGWLGLADRDLAIRLTGAVAQDPDAGWGGIDRWAVEEELRGHPDAHRCVYCGQVGCRSECVECDAFYEDPA
jgi:hypothetical protein